jgi:hypothetical protein
MQETRVSLEEEILNDGFYEERFPGLPSVFPKMDDTRRAAGKIKVKLISKLKAGPGEIEKNNKIAYKTEIKKNTIVIIGGNMLAGDASYLKSVQII